MLFRQVFSFLIVMVVPFQVTVPVVYLKSYEKLQLPYNNTNVLLSPVLGFVGAMFTTDVSSVFKQASVYEVNAYW